MYVGEIANAIELAPTRVAWMRLDVGSCYHRSTSDSPNLAIQCAKKKTARRHQLRRRHTPIK